MEIKKSDLEFLDFNITEMNLEIYQTNLFLDLNNMPIDLNYDILESEDEKDFFLIKVDLSINKNKLKKNYLFIHLKAEGYFKLNDISKKDEKKTIQYLYFTALPMLINSIRTYIMHITSFTSFGKYILPTIDLNELIKNITDK